MGAEAKTVQIEDTVSLSLQGQQKPEKLRNSLGTWPIHAPGFIRLLGMKWLMFKQNGGGGSTGPGEHWLWFGEGSGYRWPVSRWSQRDTEIHENA